MKYTTWLLTAIIAVSLSVPAMAQDKKKDHKAKKRVLTISTNGVTISDAKDSVNAVGVLPSKAPEVKKEGRFSTKFGMLDLGINVLQDNTDYTTAAAGHYLNVPANKRNPSLFDLRQGKSINVNIYPILFKYRALKTKHQAIYVTTGLGLQLYNFRYDNDITYTKTPSAIIMDTTAFRKNKLGMDYLNIPLMLNFKTKLHKDTWLEYGVGITGGYLISSWTKQTSSDNGKQKLHDDFDFNKFNSCVTAEIGIDGQFRFYASYQLTNLYDTNTGLDQHPFSFGIRFMGI